MLRFNPKTGVSVDDVSTVRERCFTSVPPLLMEVKNEAEFKARKKEDIAEMRTGVDPVKPEDEKVEEAK